MSAEEGTEIVRAVGRIEGMLQSLSATLMQSRADTDARFTKTELRIADLERSVGRSVGLWAGFALAGTILGFTIQIILRLLANGTVKP